MAGAPDAPSPLFMGSPPLNVRNVPRPKH